MASSHPRSAIDVEAELAYWSQAVSRYGFHNGEPFGKFVKSFKFAYDAYVQNQGRPLDDLWHALEERYMAKIPEQERLRWPSMMDLLRAVWERLNAPIDQTGAHERPRYSPDSLANTLR